MTDDKFETHIQTDKKLIHFQEYLVKRRAEDYIKDIYYKGAGTARPTPAVLEEIKRADTIIICPSNPLVSIGTILAIKGVHDTITRSKAVKIGISPIVGGTTIKGPADRMMKNIGMEVSAYGVAEYYKDLIDIFVIDKIDSQYKTRIEELGLTVCVTDTIMKDMQAKKRLALETLKASEKWRKN
jgi:LPPG:FO 2-phospho-L-lactate transferase